MIKIKALLSVFALFVFLNFVVLLLVLNVWYISAGHHTKRSQILETSRIHQRNILGHHPGPVGSHHKTDFAVNNNTKNRPQPDVPVSFNPILDIFSKVLFSTSSVQRLAIKSRRLDRIYDVWNLTFNTHADLCNQNDRIIAVVNSAPANVAARMAIRATWGKAFLQGNDSRLVFFVGRSKNASVQQSMQKEEALEGDVILSDFQEDYRNLTLKSVLLLRWVSVHCPGVKFVLKVDDDVFVNTANLLVVLEQRKAMRATIFGKLATGWTPVRNRKSHYFVPESSWAASIYPDFMAGPAYVMSGDVVPLLLQQVSRVPYFFLEDVYVTGMCAQKAGVSRVHQAGFRALAKPLNPCVYHGLVAAHGLRPRDMTEINGLLDRYGPEAEECWEEKCVWNWFGVCVNTQRKAVDFGKLHVPQVNSIPQKGTDRVVLKSLQRQSGN